MHEVTEANQNANTPVIEPINANNTTTTIHSSLL